MTTRVISKRVTGSQVSGSIIAPPSKSMMIRGVVAGLLAKGTSLLRNPSYCDDALAAMEVARGLGAAIETSREGVVIHGGSEIKKKSLNCQESGLSIRMFAAVAALHNEEILLEGTGSLIGRPVNMLVNPLKELGVGIETTNGYLPIRVKGPMKGGETKVDGSLSSQFLTGLLMSLPLVGADSKISIHNLKSKPYIDMTIRLMKDFGVTVEHADYEEFFIEGNQSYKPREYIVEGDWSGAAFLLVAGAIGGELLVTNLDTSSNQADIKVLEALRMAGAKLEINNNSVKVSQGNLKSFSMDITHCPDLAPPLVALASFCKGKSRLTGAKRLFAKESNRAKTLQQEFAKLGIKVDIEEDEIFITGGKIRSGDVYSHGDHRIAMAGAITAIGAKVPIIIEKAESVAKSWPGFFDDLIKIGGIVNE